MGGIALAFNCRTELQSMLQDSLPAGTAALGVFLDPQGRVLASTDAAMAVGDFAPWMAELSKAPVGVSAASQCHWNGQTYLAEQAHSKGYREFKVSDGYRDEVRSVLLTAVSEGSLTAPAFALPQQATHASAASLYYGVVQSGRMLFALGSADVVEAVSTTHIASPAAGSNLVGMLKYEIGGRMVVLPVIDSCQLTGQTPIADVSKAIAIVLRSESEMLALLVDRLVDVIACDALQLAPGGVNPDAPWIRGYIHDSQDHTEPVFVINPKGLLT